MRRTTPRLFSSALDCYCYKFLPNFYLICCYNIDHGFHQPKHSTVWKRFGLEIALCLELICLRRTARLSRLGSPHLIVSYVMPQGCRCRPDRTDVDNTTIRVVRKDVQLCVILLVVMLIQHERYDPTLSIGIASHLTDCVAYVCGTKENRLQLF